ncbi:sulfite exporter taue/safe [Lucifera butyrica]|uniref:Probable membrane transporter protein n=1 Tax=Lucifera butyrica TaxID=1351585 RepID=A0A498R645_9FIRM|nr:sulfite exporter TauE/SafE family protein [Lucifera butyrica]VBB08216.1 sulfite exporter taue/safe [Lucifera butyrica]
MTVSLAVYLFIIQFLSFIIKGLAGFGNPLLSNPLMAMRLDNKVITPANLILDMLVNAYIVWKNRKAFELKIALPVAVWIMLGVIPGTLFLKLGSPWVIKVLLGILIIGLGVEMATRNSGQNVKSNVFIRNIVSVSSGIMAGLFGINMLFLSYLERVSVERQQFRSNICFVFLIENIFRSMLYVVNDMFTTYSLQIVLISVPAAILGVWCGSRIDKSMQEHSVKKLIIGIFILGGISILIKALIFRS